MGKVGLKSGEKGLVNWDDKVALFSRITCDAFAINNANPSIASQLMRLNEDDSH